MDDLDREVMIENMGSLIAKTMWGAFRDDLYVRLLEDVARLTARKVLEYVEAEQARLTLSSSGH